MPANGMALQVGRSVPRSSGGTPLHHRSVEDALELALGEDAARDEVVGLLGGPPCDGPPRHAGRDPGRLLELAQRGAVEVDGRGRVGRVVPVEEAAPGGDERCREYQDGEPCASPGHGAAEPTLPAALNGRGGGTSRSGAVPSTRWRVRRRARRRRSPRRRPSTPRGGAGTAPSAPSRRGRARGGSPGTPRLRARPRRRRPRAPPSRPAPGSPPPSPPPSWLART